MIEDHDTPRPICEGCGKRFDRNYETVPCADQTACEWCCPKDHDHPRRCGRLDDHAPHDWPGHDANGRRRTYPCRGYVVTEGAA